LKSVIEINPLALTQPGVPAPSIFITTQTPFGGRVDLIPVISQNATTLSLSLDATISEFLGYDQPATPAKVHVDGQEQQTTLPIPAIRVRGVQASAQISDGGSLVLWKPWKNRVLRIKCRCSAICRCWENCFRQIPLPQFGQRHVHIVRNRDCH
jgi:hypothetical protein